MKFPRSFRSPPHQTVLTYGSGWFGRGGWCWLALLVLVVGLSGCHSTPRPRHRLGALPFFGPFTLYQTDNPKDLGRHEYDGLGLDETSRGIVYTCRAGFVDMAHVRTMIDWAWYSAVRVRDGLEQHRRWVMIQGMDETRYYVRFAYPGYWDELGPILEEEMIHKLAVGLGLKLALTMLTWHETITFYGYKSVGFISEHRSAFTWDDMSSHLVGLRVAADALSSHQRSLDNLALFDQSVTKALSGEMNRVGAVPPKVTKRAIESIKDDWWADGKPYKRQVETGLTDGVFHPWLVPNFAPCGAQSDRPILLKKINMMLGDKDSAFYEIWLNADLWEMKKIHSVLGIKRSKEMIHLRTDFPVLLKDIRRKVVKTKGNAALEP